MHQKAPQSTHKIQNFLGGMPPDSLEMVGPRAHQVPWLVSTSRYAPEGLTRLHDEKRMKDAFIDNNIKRQKNYLKGIP